MSRWVILTVAKSTNRPRLPPVPSLRWTLVIRFPNAVSCSSAARVEAEGGRLLARIEACV